MYPPTTLASVVPFCRYTYRRPLEKLRSIICICLPHLSPSPRLRLPPTPVPPPLPRAPRFHCEGSSEPSKGRLGHPTPRSLKLTTYGSDQPYPSPYPQPRRRLSPTRRRLVPTSAPWSRKAGGTGGGSAEGAASNICRGPGPVAHCPFSQQLLMTRSQDAKTEARVL